MVQKRYSANIAFFLQLFGQSSENCIGITILLKAAKRCVKHRTKDQGINWRTVLYFPVEFLEIIPFFLEKLEVRTGMEKP